MCGLNACLTDTASWQPTCTTCLLHGVGSGLPSDSATRANSHDVLVARNLCRSTFQRDTGPTERCASRACAASSPSPNSAVFSASGQCGEAWICVEPCHLVSQRGHLVLGRFFSWLHFDRVLQTSTLGPYVTVSGSRSPVARQRLSCADLHATSR